MSDPGTRMDIRILWQLVVQLADELDLAIVYDAIDKARLVPKVEIVRAIEATRNEF